MDSHDPQNPGPGGTTGGARDLWKTVLDEVATDAAARRARMLHKQGDKRTAIELDLLKRILIAVESRGDQSATLKRILESVQSAQATDLSSPLAAIQQGIEALAKKLAPRPKKPGDDADTVAAISKAVVDALQPLLTPPDRAESRHELIREIGNLLQQSSADQSALLKHELAEELAKLPAPAAPSAPPVPVPLPPDPTPKLDAILAAVQSPAAQEQARQLAQQQGAVLQSILQAVDREPDQTQTNLLRDLAGKLDALPRPVDPAPQLAAILDELKRRPAVDHSETLRQIAGQLEQLGAVHQQAAKLDAIEAALKDLPRQETQALLNEALALLRSPRTDDALHAKLDEALAAARAAAQPQLAARLDELLAELRSPKADPHAEVLARIHEAVTRQAEPSAAAPDVGPRFDELLERMATRESLRPFEAKLDQLVDEAKTRAGKDEALLARMLGEARDRSAATEAALQRIAGELGRSLGDNSAAINARIEQVEALHRSQAESLAKSHDQLTAAADAIAAAQARGNERLETILTGLSAKTDAGTAAALDQINARLSELATDDRQLTSIGHVLAMLQAQANRGDYELLQRIAAAVEKQADTGQREQLEAILAAVRKPADPQISATLDQILDVLTSQSAPAAPNEAALTAAAAAATAPAIERVRDEVRAASDALRKQVEALAASVREDLRAQPAAADPRQLELLHEILGEVRAPAARARQEQALDEIAAGIREQPAHQQEQARRLTSEIRQLADASRQTQQTLQRVLEAVSTRRDPVVISAAPAADAPAPFAIAPAQPMSPPTPSARPYAWTGVAAPRNRFPAAAVYAMTAAAIGIFVLLLINTFADRSSKPQTPNTLAQNGGQSGTMPQTTPPDVAKPPPVTDGGKPVAGVNASKDGGAQGSKDGDTSIIDISKALLPKQPIADGDGKSLVSPTVADLLKDQINKPRGVLAIDQATQVVLLFHATGGRPGEYASLLAELKTALGKLRDGQKYAVIFTEGDRAVEAPPVGFKAATSRERAFTEDWIARNMTGDTVRPGNNPIAAIDLAMGLEPDLLWFFTDGQPSGKPGQITPEELIQKFKAVNARGRTHIYATVTTPPGPLPPAVADAHRLLKLLAEEHGGAFGALSAAPPAPVVGP